MHGNIALMICTQILFGRTSCLCAISQMTKLYQVKQHGAVSHKQEVVSTEVQNHTPFIKGMCLLTILC